MKTLEITSLIGCPRRCDYCPQDKLSGRYECKRIMSLEDFKLYLNNVSKDVRIDFSGFVENFANPECIKMIEHASEQGYEIAIYTTLLNFTDEIIKRLEKIEFKIFCVHLKKNTKKELIKKIRNSKIKASFVSVGDDNQEDEKFIKIDKISRAGNLYEVEEKEGELECSRSDFYGNVLLPNGDVYLCCMDYGLEHKLGNLKETKYEDLKRDKSYSLCRKCDNSKIKNMISIIAVNWNTKDWCDLLIDSIKRNSIKDKNDKLIHEIIIVDNSGEITRDDVKVIKTEKNLGHGGGMDLGVKEASNDYILALDIDSHILREGWEEELLSEYKLTSKPNKETKLVAAQGGVLKPFRPCVMFFRKEYFIENNFSFSAVPVKDNFSLDVGVFFGLKTLHSGYNVAPLRVGEKYYQGVWGDTYLLNGKPTFYHNWYGSRFTGRDEVDGRKVEDFKIAKDNLFSQYEERNKIRQSEEDSNSNNSV
jgi:hypothetical protein